MNHHEDPDVIDSRRQERAGDIDITYLKSRVPGPKNTRPAWIAYMLEKHGPDWDKPHVPDPDATPWLNKARARRGYVSDVGQCRICGGNVNCDCEQDAREQMDQFLRDEQQPRKHLYLGPSLKDGE